MANDNGFGGQNAEPLPLIIARMMIADTQQLLINLWMLLMMMVCLLVVEICSCECNEKERLQDCSTSDNWNPYYAMKNALSLCTGISVFCADITSCLADLLFLRCQMDAAKNHQMARVLPAFIETRAQAKAARYPLCLKSPAGREDARSSAGEKDWHSFQSI